MNIIIKSRLVLIFTQIIGMVIGILIDRTFIHQSFERRMERMRSPGAFWSTFEKLIEPTEVQYVQMKRIVEKYESRLLKHRMKSRQEVSTTMDSLKAELQPILTEEQRDKLEQRFQRFEKPFSRPGRRPTRSFDEDPGAPPPNFEKEKPFSPKKAINHGG